MINQTKFRSTRAESDRELIIWKDWLTLPFKVRLFPKLIAEKF